MLPHTMWVLAVWTGWLVSDVAKLFGSLVGWLLGRLPTMPMACDCVSSGG
jgi:membrane protein YqaA with SNARE-associated domain